VQHISKINNEKDGSALSVNYEKHGCCFRQ